LDTNQENPSLTRPFEPAIWGDPDSGLALTPPPVEKKSPGATGNQDTRLDQDSLAIRHALQEGAGAYRTRNGDHRGRIVD
jgi:hypothetical protein